MQSSPPQGPVPPAPPFNVNKVIKLQRELAEEVLFPLYGVEVTPEVFGDLLSRVRTAADPAGDPGVYIQTCSNVLGRVFTPELGRDLAWRVAGNLPVLKGSRGGTPRPVPPWTGSVGREWVAAAVEGLEARSFRFKARTSDQAAVSKDGFVRRSGFWVEFRVLTGPPAGLVVGRFWANDACDRAKAEFGFDKVNRERYSTRVSSRVQHPFLSPAEFFGMRVLLLADQAASTAAAFAFSDVRGTSGTKAWNRALMADRARDGWACPRGYPSSVDCYKCPAGVPECRAACRPRTWTDGDCPVCSRRGWFDPAHPAACVACRAKEASS